MVSFELLAIILTGLGLMASILYYTSVLINANKTRKSQLAMNFYTHVTDINFWKPWTYVIHYYHFSTFEEWDEKYGPTTNPDAAAHFFTVMQMFVGAGTLLKEGIIEPKLLLKYLPTTTIRTSWEKYELWIAGIRTAYNDPEFGDMFEYLYKEAARLYPNVKNPRMDNPERRPSLIKLPDDFYNTQK